MDHEKFTAAERAVLALLCAGCSNKEIAAALGKAEPTVKHQVSSILRKGGVQSRCQLLAQWPRPDGLGRPGGRGRIG